MDLLEKVPNEMDEEEKAFREKVEALKNDLRSLAEPSYDEKKWTRDNVCKYIEIVKGSDSSANSCGRKLFYVGEKGSVWQNEYIIEAVVWYMRSWSLPVTVLDKLLSFDNKKFRVEVKAETEPQSCVFVDKVYDLIDIAIERKDAKLLQTLVEYLDFDNCTNYDQEEILHIIETEDV